MDPTKLLVNRATTLARQLSKRGTKIIQGKFPRIKFPLMFEEGGGMRIVLQLMVDLYNFQTRLVGISQIQTPLWKKISITAMKIMFLLMQITFFSNKKSQIMYNHIIIMNICYLNLIVITRNIK